MSENSSIHDSQVSGIVPDDYEGIESQFTQVSELPSLSHCRLVKAMRYGRWHVLKGLKAEYSKDPAHTQRLRKELEKHSPKSVKMVSLLFKPDALTIGRAPEYVGFEIPSKFILGYGLDLDGLARNLPDIYVLKEK